MIGNDIVDLITAKLESNWQRKGFLNKIFTANEQYQIKIATKPDELVWEYWSRKEAVYKIYNRQVEERFFNPKQIECLDNGIVVLNSQIYFTKTQITTNYIYSVAVLNREDFNRIEEIKRPITILKNNGIPTYFCNKMKNEKPLSITNHGNYERVITFANAI